jgi:hypothetical protein
VPVPVDLWSVLLIALLNPVVPVVAFWMGRNADQAQKLLVAAFAAALAGAVLVYIVVWLGVAGAVPATARGRHARWNRPSGWTNPEYEC